MTTQRGKSVGGQGKLGEAMTGYTMRVSTDVLTAQAQALDKIYDNLISAADEIRRAGPKLVVRQTEEERKKLLDAANEKIEEEKALRECHSMLDTSEANQRVDFLLDHCRIFLASDCIEEAAIAGKENLLLKAVAHAYAGEDKEAADVLREIRTEAGNDHHLIEQYDNLSEAVRFESDPLGYRNPDDPAEQEGFNG